MLERNNLSSIFVLDQDEALAFYVDVLGLEVGADVDFGAMRWLTVRVPGDRKDQPYGRDFAIRDPFGNHIRIGDVRD